MRAMSRTRFLKKQLGLWGSPGAAPQTDPYGERKRRQMLGSSPACRSELRTRFTCWAFYFKHVLRPASPPALSESSSNSLPSLAHTKHYWPPGTLAQIITAAILRGIPLFRYRWTINTADWAEMPKRRTCPGAAGASANRRWKRKPGRVNDLLPLWSLCEAFVPMVWDSVRARLWRSQRRQVWGSCGGVDDTRGNFVPTQILSCSSEPSLLGVKHIAQVSFSRGRLLTQTARREQGSRGRPRSD